MRASLEAIAAACGGTVRGASSSIPVSSVELDSRAVEPGALFAALPGRHAHGATFAEQAIARGAVAVLTDGEGAGLLADRADTLVPLVVVQTPRSHLGAVSALVYGTAPADLAAMDLFAITGTNGKTTVNAMVDAGLRAAGRSTAIVGTTGTVIAGERIATARTTPEAPHLHALLRRMLDAGVTAAGFEVSSIALVEGRVDGITFTVAGFTNLSRDHLDYHGTMEAYYAAKASLFAPARCSMAVIGVDDEAGQRLAAQLAMDGSVPMWTWSTLDSAAVDGSAVDWTLRDGMAHGLDGTSVPLRTSLPGAHNLANALCALAMLRRAGIDARAAAAGIATAVVPGRVEVVSAPQAPVRGIVDYAHSPDAIERVLAALRDSTPGRLIAVVGAGGDRDQEKRPLMGAAAARLADVVVVTDDNPRSEDPAVIRAAVLAGAAGAGGVLEVAGRAEAIQAAVGLAQPLDTVIVLGKGHETGQEIAGTMHPFDDREALRAALADALGSGE